MRLAGYIIALLSIFVLAACNHKELCYDHSHIIEVDVVFDWSNAQDASPETMSLYLFSEEGTKPQRYEFTGCNGGRIRIAPGRYSAVSLNSDTRNIECRDKEQLSTFLITTKDAETINFSTGYGMGTFELSTLPNPEQQRMVRVPEMLWSGRELDLEVDIERNTITIAPELSVIPVTIKILNVQNVSHVVAIMGTLSGFTEGIMAADGRESDRCVTIPFSVYISEDESELSAQLNTFGDCASGDEKHYLDLYMVLEDGSQWHYQYDVTDYVHECDDQMHIEIILDGLDIPDIEDITGGGGFVPSVDDWTSVNIDLTM